MNYLRFCRQALIMLVFICLPAPAMEPRPRSSFFGRCFSTASAWVSSSFLVTREFLKRELDTVRNQLFGFNRQIDALNATTTQSQRNISALIAAQNEHIKASETRYEHILQRVNVNNRHAEKLREQQQKMNDEFKVVHATTIASQNSVSQESQKLKDLKKEVVRSKNVSEELESTIKKKLEGDKKDIQLQLDTLNQSVHNVAPLVKVLSDRVRKLEELAYLAEQNSKQFVSESTKNSKKLEELEKCVKENKEKSYALCNAIIGFEDNYYSKIGKPKPAVLKHMEDVD